MVKEFHNMRELMYFLDSEEYELHYRPIYWFSGIVHEDGVIFAIFTEG